MLSNLATNYHHLGRLKLQTAPLLIRKTHPKIACSSLFSSPETNPAERFPYSTLIDNDSNKRRSTHTPRDSTAERIRRWWGFEIVAAILSVACFVALVVVLKKSDGREQTRWLSGWLTLNTLVALLSTFSRAAMLIPSCGSIESAEMGLVFFRHGEETP